MRKKVQTWSDLFPNDLVEDLGLETPEARSEYFLDLWLEWESTSIKLRKRNMPSMYARYGDWQAREEVLSFARKHDLKEFWDFQVRGEEIRFKDENNALLFRLTL